ncbi:GYDIA family GHMP kinase [Euzebyella saccharophila]|uniref:GYDIA family GHMP kinase n=1 Tax=Euzebyella saccharophila TaxID=679664 RepID=A0ABV8JL60_9FLAO|nr:GYDIA family GHMP kinase [Euzebyella saccharophila]
MIKEFYSHGKLLITGEYAVLDGAKSLALPTRYGQKLKVTTIEAPMIHWRSLDVDGAVWFETTFQLEALKKPSEQFRDCGEVEQTLVKLLRAARKLNPEFLQNEQGFEVETELEFPRNWGLGSSSTLINNLAQWAQVDAFQLLWNGFSGSGYDIACAQNNGPLIYQVLQKQPVIEKIAFHPPFYKNLFFVYLDKKQNSREGIARYRSVIDQKDQLLSAVNEITRALLKTQSLADFEALLNHHEELISKTIQLPMVKSELFKNYSGSVKSLGAWGGDFVLVTGNEESPTYFKEKGYTTIIPYQQMIL